MGVSSELVGTRSSAIDDAAVDIEERESLVELEFAYEVGDETEYEGRR